MLVKLGPGSSWERGHQVIPSISTAGQILQSQSGTYENGRLKSQYSTKCFPAKYFGFLLLHHLQTIIEISINIVSDFLIDTLPKVPEYMFDRKA